MAKELSGTNVRLIKDHCFWTAGYSGHSAYRDLGLAILLL